MTEVDHPSNLLCYTGLLVYPRILNSRNGAKSLAASCWLSFSLIAKLLSPNSEDLKVWKEHVDPNHCDSWLIWLQCRNLGSVENKRRFQSYGGPFHRLPECLCRLSGRGQIFVLSAWGSSSASYTRGHTSFELLFSISEGQQYHVWFAERLLYLQQESHP